MHGWEKLSDSYQKSTIMRLKGCIIIIQNYKSNLHFLKCAGSFSEIIFRVFFTEDNWFRKPLKPGFVSLNLHIKMKYFKLKNRNVKYLSLVTPKSLLKVDSLKFWSCLLCNISTRSCQTGDTISQSISSHCCGMHFMLVKNDTNLGIFNQPSVAQLNLPNY